MLKWAGYDAVGIELSPWIAEFARNAFDVQIFVGQVEAQNFEKDSLSLIILMDVLEHLVNPLETLQYCSDLLKKDGDYSLYKHRSSMKKVYIKIWLTTKSVFKPIKRKRSSLLI